MKKLLSKILPIFVIKKINYFRYKKQNIKLHKENINSGRIAKIVCKNHLKYDFLKGLLIKTYDGVIRVFEYRFYFHPVAIIKVPTTIDEYLKLIGPKSRNMNKKALKSGIECKIFNWNEKLDDIFLVNTSTSIRQGKEMDETYQKFPKTLKYPKEEDYSIVHIGAFKEGVLIGYIELYIYGNFSMTNRILGHKEYLKFGVMNLMVKECVEYAIKNDIAYINYLTMQNRQNNSLSAFKYRVGFREYSLVEM